MEGKIECEKNAKKIVCINKSDSNWNLLQAHDIGITFVFENKREDFGFEGE